MRGMADRQRRSWRAAPATLVGVSIFVLAAGVVVPTLAYLIYQRQHSVWIPAALLLLAVAALVYAWRFGYHPRVRSDGRLLIITNPFRKHVFEWDDITVIAPGENGLLVGSDEAYVEAWCVQKSNYAAHRGRFTRADRISHELLDILDQHDPPLTDEETGLRIRRGRPDESRLLTRLERAAAEHTLGPIFPPEDYPYPVAEVTRSWRRLLHDRTSRVYLLELDESPVGFVAFDADTIHRLGVAPQHTRRGYGSALLAFASREIFDGGELEASQWMLTDNTTGRHFLESHGWRSTEDRRRSGHPPQPETERLVHRNPHAPRRSR